MQEKNIFCFAFSLENLKFKKKIVKSKRTKVDFKKIIGV